MIGHGRQAAVFDQLRRLAAWEVEAQVGAHRPVEEGPALLAAAVRDFFDMALEPDLPPAPHSLATGRRLRGGLMRPPTC
jgi:hypothetical protein